MHRNAKPARKCHGCGLNLGDHCGVFANPREQWREHTICPGYKNETMLAGYEAAQMPKSSDAHKEKRHEVAVQRRTETHHNGDQHVRIATVRR